ncbi:MAG: hypothetical protein AVDCRST_MAG02-4893 [uncultured Rubrobacteraceae bacterium]|uniref:Uncharacterized protein n=1 Tax=uncultured Rubrobacteraceae bacterium TaxID=349277 RepID=A0A6J4S3U8_9ACTN|nr:MAG: hypothetical protein AVDCRST_MAG02-4893 [uncultured Rubrobacteraceae bacterium]
MGSVLSPAIGQRTRRGPVFSRTPGADPGSCTPSYTAGNGDVLCLWRSCTMDRRFPGRRQRTAERGSWDEPHEDAVGCRLGPLVGGAFLR